MVGFGSTQRSMRQALGALKDSTTIGLAKVNSDYKKLDIAIVRATNHVERLAKEKHMHTIFHAVSAAQPRADVAYCIDALVKQLFKTSNWVVALKTLIVIHRTWREVDPSFQEEFTNYTRSRGHTLNLSHFKDYSSLRAWDYSAWIQTYALYLEERFECFRKLKYDVETEHTRTLELDTVDLLEQLPALQQLLFHLLGCQPEISAACNSMIKYALSIIVGESFKIYNAINEGILYLVDTFFEMPHQDATRALQIYRKAGLQAEGLSKFYEICKSVDVGRGKIFIKIEQPPASFIAAMEEYVKGSPSPCTLPPDRNMIGSDRGIPPKARLAIEHNKLKDDHEKSEPIPAPTPATPEPPATQTTEAPVTDLLDLDDFDQDAMKLEEKNVLELAISGDDDNPLKSTHASKLRSETTGWELALVGAPSSNKSCVAERKLAGGLDSSTLDSLYNDAIARRTNPGGSYHMGQMAVNSFEIVQYPLDPLYASTAIGSPADWTMAEMAQQQAYMRRQQQQQQQPLGQNDTNPFSNPFEAPSVRSYPPHNPYTG